MATFPVSGRVFRLRAFSAARVSKSTESTGKASELLGGSRRPRGGAFAPPPTSNPLYQIEYSGEASYVKDFLDDGLGVRNQELAALLKHRLVGDKQEPKPC